MAGGAGPLGTAVGTTDGIWAPASTGLAAAALSRFSCAKRPKEQSVVRQLLLITAAQTGAAQLSAAWRQRLAVRPLGRLRPAAHKGPQIPALVRHAPRARRPLCWGPRPCRAIANPSAEALTARPVATALKARALARAARLTIVTFAPRKTLETGPRWAPHAQTYAHRPRRSVVLTRRKVATARGQLPSTGPSPCRPTPPGPVPLWPKALRPTVADASP